MSMITNVLSEFFKNYLGTAKQDDIFSKCYLYK